VLFVLVPVQVLPRGLVVFFPMALFGVCGEQMELIGLLFCFLKAGFLSAVSALHVHLASSHQEWIFFFPHSGSVGEADVPPLTPQVGRPGLLSLSFRALRPRSARAGQKTRTLASYTGLHPLGHLISPHGPLVPFF